jgi:hypothetical protein
VQANFLASSLPNDYKAAVDSCLCFSGVVIKIGGGEKLHRRSSEAIAS